MGGDGEEMRTRGGRMGNGGGKRGGREEYGGGGEGIESGQDGKMVKGKRKARRRKAEQDKSGNEALITNFLLRLTTTS